MHIEKNICDNILGTLMNIESKIKNNINAHQDMAEFSIQSNLRLKEVGD